VCPYGDSAQAVVLGSVYQNAYGAPANSKAVHRTLYADGTRIEYDSSSSIFTVNVGSGSVVIHCARATIKAADQITLDSPNVYATGNLRVKGNLTAQCPTASTTAAQP
jgi:phage baseplate assembly protein V